MVCPNCSGNEFKKVRRDQAFPRSDGSFFIVRNLLVLECQECGESLIPAESSREIDRILSGSKRIEEYIEIPTYQAKTA